MPSDKKLLGAFGEETACRYLRRHGYTILDRNYVCRLGELDIVARKGRYVAFVEVKLRKNADFGVPAEYVTAAKQRRVILAAERWLQTHRTDLQPRFDVIEVYAPKGLETIRPEIHHLEDAYTL